jgi:hypothetical protein
MTRSPLKPVNRSQSIATATARIRKIPDDVFWLWKGKDQTASLFSGDKQQAASDDSNFDTSLISEIRIWGSGQHDWHSTEAEMRDKTWIRDEMRLETDGVRSCDNEKEKVLLQQADRESHSTLSCLSPGRSNWIALMHDVKEQWKQRRHGFQRDAAGDPPPMLLRACWRALQQHQEARERMLLTRRDAAAAGGLAEIDFHHRCSSRTERPNSMSTSTPISFLSPLSIFNHHLAFTGIHSSYKIAHTLCSGEFFSLSLKAHIFHHHHRRHSASPTFIFLTTSKHISDVTSSRRLILLCIFDTFSSSFNFSLLMSTCSLLPLVTRHHITQIS